MCIENTPNNTTRKEIFFWDESQGRKERKSWWKSWFIAVFPLFRHQNEKKQTSLLSSNKFLPIFHHFLPLADSPLSPVHRENPRERSFPFVLPKETLNKYRKNWQTCRASYRRSQKQTNFNILDTLASQTFPHLSVFWISEISKKRCVRHHVPSQFGSQLRQWQECRERHLSNPTSKI